MDVSDELIQFVKMVDLFQDLDDAEVGDLLTSSQEIVLEDKKFVFKETEEGDAMYVVIDGTIKIVKLVTGMKFKTLVALGIGDFFGEMALLDGEPRSASAISHGHARVLRVGRDEFSSLMSANPYLGLKVLIRLSRNLSDRLRKTNSQVIEMVSWNLQQQEANKEKQ